MVDQLGARISDLSDAVEALSQPGQGNQRTARPVANNNRIINPNDKDNFVSSNGGDGGLSGAKGLLSQVGNMYANGVGNANPMFRFSIADASVGLLNSAAAIIQGALQDETIKNSPLKSMANSLSAMVNTLLGLVKQMSSEHTETIKGDRRLSQSMTDLAKSASG